MKQLELQNAIKLFEKFKDLKDEFNSKYEDLAVEIYNDGDLKIIDDYFTYEQVNQLEQVIIDYKKIIKG